MKKEDVKNERKIGIVSKHGLEDEEGNIIVPIEYDYISKVNEDLFVATKGCINGLRYANNKSDEVEKGSSYGVFFNERLEEKSLDTELDFYTPQGKLFTNKKILAAIVCLNKDMIVLLDENYKWSIALINYDTQVIREIVNFSRLDFLKMDYNNRRFIVTQDYKTGIVTFDKNNKISELIPPFESEAIEVAEKGIVVKIEGKYGFMDFSGDMILECAFDEVVPFDEYIKTKENGMTIIYKYSGVACLVGPFTSIEHFKLEGASLFKTQFDNGDYGLYSMNKVLLQTEYSAIEYLSDGTMIICRNNSYCLARYNKEKDEIISILPGNFFSDSCKKSYDKMWFAFKKSEINVCALKGEKQIMYNIEGKKLPKQKIARE